MMRLTWRFSLVAAGVAVVLGLGWWLGSPLFLNRMVDEAAPGEMMMSDATGMTGPMSGQSDMMGSMKPMSEGMPFSGMFMDGDERHHAMGSVQVITADERQYLRFESFEVTNGPDLFVILVKTGMEAKDGINLGALKGNVGNQNYELPTDTDFMSYSRVVIWCRAFNVTFSTADLRNMQ